MVCDDERLQYLLDQIGQRLDQSLRCKSELIMHILQSLKLLRSRHPDYDEALNLTMLWVIKKIEGFKPESPPPTRSEEFILWVNGYLKWRIKDLNRPDDIFKTVSTDEPIYEDKGATRESVIEDPKPNLNSLDALVEQWQAEQTRRIGLEVQNYIQQDPQGFLRSCHPRKSPECNGQVLAIRIHLNHPPETIRSIAKEFALSEQMLYTHWREKCSPRLRVIALRFDSELKQQITEPQVKERLLQIQSEQNSTCNCWQLVEQLLLTDSLQDIKPHLWKHWEKSCLPILKPFRS